MTTLTIGEAVQIITVQSLPESLIGQTGTIESFILPDVPQIRVNGKLWTMPIGNLKPRQAVSSGLQDFLEAKRNHRQQIALKLRRSYWSAKEKGIDKPWLAEESDRASDEATQIDHQINS